MSEKVVLPKFDLPGQGTHPAIRVLQGVGGLLGVGLLVLGVAMWRQHSLQLAAETHAQALIAARAVEVTATAEAAKARATEATAKLETAKVAARAAADAKVAARAESRSSDAAATAGSARHHHHAGKGKALANVTKSDDKKVSRPGSKRDDAAIDKLLASFK